MGVKAVRENGGLTLAQGSNRTEPRFRDMPESAAATGQVDIVAPVEEMPQRLLKHLRTGTIEGERIAAAMGKIYNIIRGRIGHDFSEYKDKTFERHLQRPGALMPNILRSAYAMVMDRFAPAHVVVNAEGEVLHYSIKTGRYLEPPSARRAGT